MNLSRHFKIVICLFDFYGRRMQQQTLHTTKHSSKRKQERSESSLHLVLNRVKQMNPEEMNLSRRVNPIIILLKLK